MKRFLPQIIACATMLALVVSLSSVTKVSAGNNQNNDKVKICHSTSSHSNPYIENEPDKSGDLNGHVGHTGGVYPAEPWGDIIPPFDYQVWEKVGSHEECPTSNSAYSFIWAPGKTCHKLIGGHLKFAYPITVDDYDWVTHNFPGMNWNPDGQAIWDNDCEIPPVDLCSNLEGIQAEIPQGYEDPDQDGVCTEITEPTPTPSPSSGGQTKDFPSSLRHPSP